MRGTFALLLVAVVAGTVGAEGIDEPPSSPLAKRKREEAQAAGSRGRAVHEKVRARRADDDVPPPDVLRQAIADLEEAIADYERSLEMEWSPDANREEIECVRAWVALRGLLPEDAPPAAVEDKEKWQQEQARAAKERARDARRFLTGVLRLRRPGKLFERCGRCDGRGELRSAFGDKTNCPVCRGEKLRADRKNLMKGYWLPYTPFYRASHQHRRNIDSVLRLGVPAENRIAPFIVSATIAGKVEEHDGWYRFTVLEKVVDGRDRQKPVERESTYVVVCVGKTFWIHSASEDGELLKLPAQDG